MEKPSHTQPAEEGSGSERGEFLGKLDHMKKLHLSREVSQTLDRSKTASRNGKEISHTMPSYASLMITCAMIWQRLSAATT